MKIDTQKLRYRLKLVWFHARNQFTKALGLIGMVTGYALETQAQWVQWLTDKPRGIATKWLGISVFALGVYNHFFPPAKPAVPTSEDTP